MTVFSSTSPQISKLKEYCLYLQLIEQELKKGDCHIYDAIPLEELESDVESCENFDFDILRVISE